MKLLNLLWSMRIADYIWENRNTAHDSWEKIRTYDHIRLHVSGQIASNIGSDLISDLIWSYKIRSLARSDHLHIILHDHVFLFFFLELFRVLILSRIPILSQKIMRYTSERGLLQIVRNWNTPIVSENTFAIINKIPSAPLLWCKLNHRAIMQFHFNLHITAYVIKSFSVNKRLGKRTFFSSI